MTMEKMDRHQTNIAAATDEVKQTITKSELERAMTNSDAKRLAELGYENQLERGFSLPALIGLCLCLMGTWEATSSVLAQALLSGGAPCLWYNFLLTFLCTVAIGMSLAEIASIYPTSGGQYHWVTALCPRYGRMTAAWLTGWISIGAQIVMAASSAFYSSLMIQGLIILNNSSYQPERWHVTLLNFAVLLYAVVINIWGNKALPTANLISGALHIGGFLAIFITLAITAKKNSAEYVFITTINETGWQSSSVAWLVGMVSSLYPFLGYDAACHLAEELPHASRNVPLAMIGSIVANGLIGVAFVTMLLFSTGPLESVLATPTGFPVIQIYFDATNSHAGTTLMTLVSVLTAIAATCAAITSASRTLWAFARDSATPVHSWLGSLHAKANIPANGVVVIAILDALLALLYIGNPTATTAILSMAIMSMYLSYLAPIVCMLFWGRRSLRASEYGPFKLRAPLGIALNIISMLWIVLSITFSVFPTVVPVTIQNANYSPVVTLGWIFLGAAYFAIKGRKKFEMPVVQVHYEHTPGIEVSQ